MPAPMIKLDAFGRTLLAERTTSGWALYDLGAEGKRTRASDLIVPDFIAPDELETFIGDLLHEFATPRHPVVKRLADIDSGTLVRLRHLTPGDAQAYHAFRLAALAASPDAFGASADEEERLSIAEVRMRITPSEDGAPFVVGAFAPGESVVGVCGLYRERSIKVRHIGWIWGMFVTAHWRRQGLGRQLLQQVTEDARAVPGLTQLQLRVGAENTLARNLYSSAGYQRVAVLPRALRVGSRYFDEALMVLDLSGEGMTAPR